MALDVLIEGLLFYKASPQNKVNLMKLFACPEEEFHQAIETLRTRLKDSAIRLLETEDDVELVTAPEMTDFIQSLHKDELQKDIGKAGAETLAIILYKEPVTRAEIDQIRGVNSSFILRNLLVRGLIEKQSSKGTQRYKVSSELLKHMGVEQKYDLPRFAEFMDIIESFEHSNHERD